MPGVKDEASVNTILVYINVDNNIDEGAWEIATPGFLTRENAVVWINTYSQRLIGSAREDKSGGLSES